ncbi:MAG: ATP-dependent RecD-like DNA helicase [Clostridia bacterium]|nr:ATP-dependent RecD-like DNA helicase [Clostridia bacterium]
MVEREEQLIHGTVKSVLFQNPENGYSVIKLMTDEGELITVVGTIPITILGERLIITGKWGYHANHGPQFEAEFLERMMPETRDEIFAFLSSKAVKGIGEKIAARIVERFGAESLDVLEQKPELLTQIPGISLRKAQEMSESFRRQSGIRRLIEFLTIHHLPAELAVRLYRVYGEMASDALRDDPYLLTDPYFSADFGLVDAFALELDVAADDERRVEAGILFELSFNLNHGHTFIPKEKLLAASSSLLGLDGEQISAGMIRLQEQNRLVTDEVAGLSACYLPEFYEAECYVCSRILGMAKEKTAIPENLESLLESIELRNRIDYAPMQMQAIREATGNRLLIVTGGPGTGKTTVMTGILDLFDSLKIKTQLAAPTGRAAKRLSEVTGREASTIHRLLESQFDEQTGEMSFYHDEDEPLPCDAMIVDETSMVDLQLMMSLLRALKPRCRLILVGDPDQLPSVGAGNVFSDLIRSGVVKTVRLTDIFRQAQESLIVMNAHAVNAGELPVLNATDRDFFFLRRRNPADIVSTIQELCATRLPNKMGIPVSDIQVLAPSRKQEAGTKNLNQALQAVLNPPAPGKREKRYGNFSFREGDRVMQIRNNYDIMWKRADGLGAGTGIFNGDIGRIKSIDFETELVTVSFDERTAEYAFDMLGELEPAYAMTVHKSQGSEYRAVILSACPASQLLLTRSVLYTAITRARELLIVVGYEDVIAAMAQNNRKQRRYSGLKLRLQKMGEENA